MLYWVHLAWTGFELTALVVICTDCIVSFNGNYYTIITTTVPDIKVSHVVVVVLYTGHYREVPHVYWLVTDIKVSHVVVVDLYTEGITEKYHMYTG